MSFNHLSSDVVGLLRDNVRGSSDLELLLVMRSDPTKGWTASSLADALELSEARVADSLDALCAAALLLEEHSATTRRFYYRPATPALEASVTALAEVYKESPADVVRALNDNAIARVRSAAVLAFPTAHARKND